MAFCSINAILVHPLMENMHLSTEEIGFVTSTFVLTFALTQLPLGTLLDHWGARKTQTLFIIIGAAGIIIFGLASNLTMLSLCRAVPGFTT